MLFPLGEPRRRDHGRSPSTTTTATSATPPRRRSPYRLTDAPIGKPAFWKQVERDLVDHLARSLTHGAAGQPRAQAVRPAGESVDDFAARCLHGRRRAGRRRDGQAARQVRGQGDDAARPDRRGDRRRRGGRRPAAGARTATSCCRRPARSSAGCSVAAGRGAGCSAARPRRRPAPGSTVGVGPGSRRRRTRSPGCRTTSRTSRPSWPRSSPRSTRAGWTRPSRSTTMPITLERTDVKVTQLALAWLPTT